MLLKGEGVCLACRPRVLAEATRRSVGCCIRDSLDVPFEAPGFLRATGISPCVVAPRVEFSGSGGMKMLASSIWGAAAISVRFTSRSMTVQVLEIISLDSYSQWDEVDSLGAPRSNGLRVSYLLVFSGPRLSSLMARTTFCVGSESPAVGYCPISVK